MNYSVRVFESKAAFIKKESPLIEAEYKNFSDAINGKNSFAMKKKWFVVMIDKESKIRWIYDPKSSK